MRNRIHRSHAMRPPSGRASSTEHSPDRIKVLMASFVVLGVLIVGRLFMVQVISHPLYEALATGQRELVRKLLPQRGEMYAQDRFSDTGLTVIATNQIVYHVFANPKQAQTKQQNIEQIAQAISPVLGVDSQIIHARLTKLNDVYEPLKRQVKEQELNALKTIIADYAVVGIDWVEEEGRYYPEGMMQSSFTGFVGMMQDEPTGQYGLEGHFNDQLSGTEGHLSTELDASGRFIAVGEKSITPAKDGNTLILTIDKNIQYKACTALAAAVEKHGAPQGSVIVMHPKTGAVLALCNAPMYDPNRYNDVTDIEMFNIDAISEPYEPGSVFKAFTMAAAVNEGHVTPYTEYEDKGAVQVGVYSISNSDGKTNGVMTMTQVLEKSLNTGAVFAVQKVGNEKWERYVQAFGFGDKTGIQLSGEQAGNISALAQHKDVYSATSSFGQGITVTPLQMIQGYAAIANEGVMMKPYIVDRVLTADGFQEQTTPEVTGTPIRPETARTLSAMLVRVIDNTYSHRAAIKGYFLAGKTGTAQVPRTDGVAGYDPDMHKDTFIGFGPVSDPQFVILAKIDFPKDVRWAEGSAAPLFREIAQYLITYLQIPPDRHE